MTMPTAPIDDRAPPPCDPAPLALVREVQGPTSDRGRVAGLAMVCSAAGVALGFALAGSLFAAMTPPRPVGIGPAGYSACSTGPRWRAPTPPVEPMLIAARPRPWLGITVDAGTKGAPAELTGVVIGAPASQAGLRPGDVVTRFDGREVSTASELLALIRTHQAGDLVSIEARSRDGRRVSVDGLRLSAMPMAPR